MPDKNISHYKILGKLGEGGMGVVFKAHDTKLDRPVALKLLPLHLQSGDDAKERFLQEARAASALDHPNVCTIHEIGESEDGSMFISMAYYEGESLQERIKRGAPGFSEALDIAIQTARGLQSAHESGIVHRDIKPGNIMLTPRGDVKIVDFGLAKLAGQSRLTQSGSTIGTAAYMSPEQINNEAVDHRSDIFSFGLLLYELFTGIHPFKSDYFHAMMYSIINDEPKPVTDLNPELPDELQWIIEKTIRKNSNDRYQTMNDLVIHLEALKNGSVKLPEIILQDKPSAKKQAVSGKKSYTGILITAVVSVLVLTTVVMLSVRGTISMPPLLSGVEIPEYKQIAVLPFRNIGGDSENQVFVDGLVETLSSKLSQLEQFQDNYLVIPASETIARNISTASLARETFGVNLVVTGSVQQLDRGVRVILNLIDASTLRQIESRIIDDTFIESSVLQDGAVFNLANMLGMEVKPEVQKVLTAGGTTVPGAYEFYLRGIGHLQRFDRIEDINAAIHLFNRALEEDPDFALAHAALGDANLYLYRRTKNTDWFEPAERSIRQAIEIDRTLSPVHTSLGTLLTEKGEYEMALDVHATALELNPTNFESYRGRARAFSSLQRLSEAEATYKKAIEIKPDYWAGYAELGVFYSQHGRFEESAEQFEIVTKLSPGNASAYRNLGGVYYYLGRQDKALDAFRKSVEIQPNYGVYSNMATMNYYNGNFSEAALNYEKALELNDSDYKVWSFLGSAYKYSDPPNREGSEKAVLRAIELAEKQLEINPRDPELLLSLSSYHIDLDEDTKAETFLERALRMEPAEVNNVMNVGIIYEHLGNRNEALKWIEKAVDGGYRLEEFLDGPDPELDSIRNDPEFLKIADRYLIEDKN